MSARYVLSVNSGGARTAGVPFANAYTYAMSFDCAANRGQAQTERGIARHVARTVREITEGATLLRAELYGRGGSLRLYTRTRDGALYGDSLRVLSGPNLGTAEEAAVSAAFLRAAFDALPVRDRVIVN